MEDQGEARRQQFYNDKAWLSFKTGQEARQLGMDIYEYYTTGNIIAAENYHHIEEVIEAWDRRLDVYNVLGLSEANHRRIHIEYNRGEAAKRKLQRNFFNMLERFYREFTSGGGI